MVASKDGKTPEEALAKRKVGNPSGFTQAIADRLCDRIACGHSLKSVLREPGQPAESMVYRWLRGNPAFREQYARAREEMADADADSVGDIGHRVLLGEIDPLAARVAIDAFKWSAGKRNAKKYGDKMQLAGHDGDALPAPLAWVIAPVAPKPE